MLFSMQEKREELRMRSENQAMNILLQRQYDQYRLSIDNIELLRREFHDLNINMIVIRSGTRPEKKEQYLSEMEEAIHTQEAFTNTGKQCTGCGFNNQKYLLYAKTHYFYLACTVTAN